MRLVLLTLFVLSGCVSQGHTVPIGETNLVAPEKSLQAFKASCDKPNATQVLASNDGNHWAEICKSISSLDLVSSDAAQAFFFENVNSGRELSPRVAF